MSNTDSPKWTELVGHMFSIFIKEEEDFGCNQIVAILIPVRLPEQTEPDVLVQQTAALSLCGWGHHMAIEEH